MGHLLRLQVGGDEDVRRQAERRCGCRRGAGQVAGRGAGQGLEAEGGGLRRGHRHGPILEGERRVARVVLQPQALDADGFAQPLGGHERRGADPQTS